MIILCTNLSSLQCFSDKPDSGANIGSSREIGWYLCMGLVIGTAPWLRAPTFTPLKTGFSAVFFSSWLKCHHLFLDSAFRLLGRVSWQDHNTVGGLGPKLQQSRSRECSGKCLPWARQTACTMRVLCLYLNHIYNPAVLSYHFMLPWLVAFFFFLTGFQVLMSGFVP